MIARAVNNFTPEMCWIDSKPLPTARSTHCSRQGFDDFWESKAPPINAALRSRLRERDFNGRRSDTSSDRGHRSPMQGRMPSRRWATCLRGVLATWSQSRHGDHTRCCLHKWRDRCCQVPAVPTGLPKQGDTRVGECSAFHELYPCPKIPLWSVN